MTEATKWAESRLKLQISDSTTAEYKRVFMRLATENRLPGGDNGRTRAVERAAMRHGLAKRIVSLDKLGGHEDLIASMYSIAKRIDSEAKSTQKEYKNRLFSEHKNVQKRHTKRRSLRGLPSDWREQLVKAAAGSKYDKAVQVMAACGCRPAELAKGVEIRRNGDVVIIKITGAKVSENTGGGQAWREISLVATHPLLEGLVIPGKYSVPNARAIENAVEHFARVLWPRRAEPISAYSLRHAAASDFKAAGLDKTEVAAALGHQSTATMSRYGSANRTGKGGLALIGATAAKEVRQPAKGARARPRTKKMVNGVQKKPKPLFEI